MGFWTDVPIGVPRVIWRRLEALVEEVTYLDTGQEISAAERRDLAEELAIRILHEYVREHFEDSTKAVAQMFRQRRSQRREWLELNGL